MGSISDVRNGLKTRLATISGLSAYALVPMTPNLPTALVQPRSIDFDTSMTRGSDRLIFDVTLLVADSITELAQSQLDPYLSGSGAQSVKAAIEADQTLGGAADWCRVTEVNAYGDMPYSGKLYLGARFTVEVDVDGA
jgi:hypothetical protein